VSSKLQVKSAVLMTKRKLRLIVAACAIVVLGLWIFGIFWGRTSDAARHRAWGRTGRIWSELRSVNKRLPTGFVRVFRLSRLEQEHEDRWGAERDALVASGYFTNVALTIPRAEEPPDTAPYYEHRRAVIRQTADRVRKALQGHGEFQCSYPSNGVVIITCRPQDVPLCAEALQK